MQSIRRRQTFFPGAFLAMMLGGCNSPCDDFCTSAMQKLVDCKILRDSQEAIDAEVDACLLGIEQARSSDEACSGLQADFAAKSCIQLQRDFCGHSDPNVICEPVGPCPADDGNRCTEDLCENDVPVHVPHPGLVLPNPEGDCRTLVCDEHGLPHIYAADDDFVADNNPCTKEWCSSGDLHEENLANGAVCDEAKGFVCVDLVCRAPCTGMQYVPGTIYPSESVNVARSQSLAADLNGDGLTDLVFWRNQDVSILFNEGEGLFSPALNYPFSTMFGGPNSVVTLDLDNDGRLDLAITQNGSKNIRTLINQGDDFFVMGSDIAYAIGYPGPLAVADMDGDADLDLLAGDDANKFCVLSNLGNGSFASPACNSVAGTRFNPADLNADGKIDIIVEADALTSVLLNQGGGLFGAAITVGGKGRTAVGDFNQDGKVDIVSGNGRLYFGHGDGSFDAPQDYGTGILFAGSVPVVLDADDDGLLDVAATIGGGNSTVQVFRNQGGGTLKPNAMMSAAGANTYSIETFDVDADGKLDLLLPNASDMHFDVLRNLGGANFSTAKERIRINSPSPGAFVGDTRQFFIVDGRSLKLFDSPQSSQATKTYEVWRRPRAVAVGNLGGAANFGVVTANPGTSDVAVLLGSPEQLGLPQYYSMGGKPQSVALPDLNGDGYADIVAANGVSNDLTVRLNLGNGVFDNVVSYPVSPNPGFVAAADLSGDGKPDLAVTSSVNNTLSIFLNLGDGTLDLPITYTLGQQIGAIVAGDLNGDTALDLALVSPGDQRTYVLFNEGAGTFSAPAAYEPGVRPSSLELLDIDTDGKLDIAVANRGTLFDAGNVAFLYNDGQGKFTISEKLPVGTNPLGLSAGMVNKDQRLDLVISQGNGPTLLGVLKSFCQ